MSPGIVKRYCIRIFTILNLVKASICNLTFFSAHAFVYADLVFLNVRVVLFLQLFALIAALMPSSERFLQQTLSAHVLSDRVRIFVFFFVILLSEWFMVQSLDLVVNAGLNARHRIRFE